MRKIRTNVLVLVFLFLLILFSIFSLEAAAVQNSSEAVDCPPCQRKQIENRENYDTSKMILEDQVQEAKPKYNPRSEVARQHMSEVARVVEELILFSDRLTDRGLGEEIREVARDYSAAEDKVNRAFDKAGERGNVIKFLIGPNYKQLKEIKQEIQQNQVRIQKLQRIMAQVENEADKTELQNKISLIESQNVNLQNQLKEATSGFSLFGWLFKLIYKYH